MKRVIYLTFVALMFASCDEQVDQSAIVEAQSNGEWTAQWIAPQQAVTAANSWILYTYHFDCNKRPKDPVIARIGVDSKYWLIINNRMAVCEGGLKRGPNPNDTYYDAVDIREYLRRGHNEIKVLVWFFGKDGFSHNNSGKGALIFDCQTPEVTITSSSEWNCSLHTAFSTCAAPIPNFRLSESSILYDARVEKEWAAWDNHHPMDKAAELGPVGTAPWNNLIRRPIPMWRTGKLKPYDKETTHGDTIVCTLPENMQLTPYIKLRARAGEHITIMTDNYLKYDGGARGVRCEYITTDGKQEYENLGWMNGHEVYYIIPKGVEVLDLCFRQSGYDTYFAGHFCCNDEFWNTLWDKARKTLYITMRDSYMDCPDRERAQWTGDAVNESGEAFYALSPSSALLTRKWLHELCAWQRDDSTLYSPTPSSNWHKELPAQSLASVGYYGLWNYYINTGDIQTLEELYPAVERYLDVWEAAPDGTIMHRAGEWDWADWGYNVDVTGLQNIWYYLTLKSMALSADELGYEDDCLHYAARAEQFRHDFNRAFWNGSEYRSADYQSEITDDRTQALAVVAGLVDEERYGQILTLLQQNRNASPYMEKYVFEAMMKMGCETEALKRHRERFAFMVEAPFSTLFEGWGIGRDGVGGGTINHAWSGGALTVLSQYVCGIEPLDAAYAVVGIQPQPSGLEWAEASMKSVAGWISSRFYNEESQLRIEAEVPAECKCVIGAPTEGIKCIDLDGVRVWCNGKMLKPEDVMPYRSPKRGFVSFEVNGGKHTLTAHRTCKQNME